MPWIIQVGPKADDKCERRKKQRPRRESHVKTKVKTRVMQTLTTECLEPSEAGGGKKGFSLESMETLLTLLF